MRQQKFRQAFLVGLHRVEQRGATRLVDVQPGRSVMAATGCYKYLGRPRYLRD